MRERYHKLIRTALAAAALTSAACAMTFAQATSSNVTLDLKDVDVRSAIESLFRGTGKNFAIQGDVQGIIPGLSVRDVPFETALKGLAKAADLTYRIDGDIYLIQKKQAVVEAVPQIATEEVYIEEPLVEESIIDKVPLSHTGASELLSMMSGDWDSNNSNSGYGGWGGSNNSGWGSNNSGWGGSGGGWGGSNFGGSNFGGSNFGGSNYGGSNYGGSNFGSNYGGRSW